MFPVFCTISIVVDDYEVRYSQGSMFPGMSMFARFNVPEVQCSRVRCSRGSMFPGFIVPRFGLGLGVREHRALGALNLGSIEPGEHWHNPLSESKQGVVIRTTPWSERGRFRHSILRTPAIHSKACSQGGIQEFNQTSWKWDPIWPSAVRHFVGLLFWSRNDPAIELLYVEY